MKWLFLPVCLLVTCVACFGAPIELRIPQVISAEQPSLGLPVQQGMRHYVIYSPDSNPGLGWANHDVRMLRLGNQMILWWTSHLGDENGPGQTLAATVISFDAESGTPKGLDNLKFTRVVPAPLPERRRTWDFTADTIDEYFCHGRLCLRGDQLWLDGKIEAFHGVSDEYLEYVKGRKPGDPAPIEHFREKYDTESGFVNEYEWILTTFQQRWGIEDGELRPLSPPYLSNPFPTHLEVVPGKVKAIAGLPPEWLDFPLVETAPQDIYEAWKKPTTTDRSIVAENRVPPCLAGLHTAADGKNGLAHYTDFVRSDGTCVCIRDNLKNPGFYYAAEKTAEASGYPPAELTNLPGEAMAAAGNLPDGRAYIVCNYDYRRNLYIVLSKDGRIFDTARFVLRITRKFQPGIGKFNRKTGPHYPRTMVVGKKLWITYSIGKEQIGLTTIDLSEL